MNAQLTTQPDPLRSRARLFAPGRRLGWIFRDRQSYVQPFTEPPPAEPVESGDLQRRAHSAALDHRARCRAIAKIGGGAVLSLLFLAVIGQSGGLATLAILVALGGVGTLAMSYFRHTQAQRAVEEHDERQAANYNNVYQAWQQRKLAHEQAESSRVDRLDEWGAVGVSPTTRRIDVFGGSVRSRQALLTVYATSTLPERPVIVLDLTADKICEQLVPLAIEAGVPVDLQLLPSDLSDTSLLAGLEPGQLIDALIESMYGDDVNAARAERSMDTRILKELCKALGEELTLSRLGAGLRALMGEPDESDTLTRHERNRIADELFSDEYRRQAYTNVRRIESFIHPLEKLGSRPADLKHAYLTCLALDDDGISAQNELLIDLMVQWLTRQLKMMRQLAPAIIIAGGEDVKRRHFERLSDICERCDVQAMFLFPHLRETTQELIGGGAVAFMRLGNHKEAMSGAEFIGRGHKFEISQLTNTLGGNESYSVAKSDGGSKTRGSSLSTAISWGTNWSSNTSETRQPSGPAGLGSTLGSTTSGHSSGGNRSQTETTGTNESNSTTWSTTRTQAEGTNWSNASTKQRVYEFMMEPAALQGLPDFALLLLDRQAGGAAQWRMVEFNPEIVTLDRVSTAPLPELPYPHPISTPTSPAANPGRHDAPQHDWPTGPEQRQQSLHPYGS
ncbi:MAG: hypothetical protein ACRDSR_23275 [Pseudonocardiaceae bacterium]